MGRPRRKAGELTTDEVMRKLFPSRAVKAAKSEAQKADERAEKREKTKGKKPRKKEDNP